MFRQFGIATFVVSVLCSCGPDRAKLTGEVLEVRTTEGLVTRQSGGSALGGAVVGGIVGNLLIGGKTGTIVGAGAGAMMASGSSSASTKPEPVACLLQVRMSDGKVVNFFATDGEFLKKCTLLRPGDKHLFNRLDGTTYIWGGDFRGVYGDTLLK